jgi:biotin synthase
MQLNDLISKSLNDERLTADEVAYLLSLPPTSPETYRLLAASRELSAQVCSGSAEVHAQFAINLAPCPKNCMFCSFAVKNGIFKGSSKIAPDAAVTSAQTFEQNGANAIYLMATASFDLNEFCEYGREVRRNLRPDTLLIANVGDQDISGARLIKDAGFNGVYHALRLREGTDSDIQPEDRLRSIRAFKEAGLIFGTCVEPLGPEHTNEELAELILFTAAHQPAFSGAARRISIPGTELAKRGMISELRMAQIVAVTRLAVPHAVKGNCTHEPCGIGALAGANLFWAETGANPRDIKEKTEEGRGHTVESCRTIFSEADWNLLDGPSAFFS